MKLKEIRTAYEELSGTFSSTVRTLAISGIAIVWLFIDKGSNGNEIIILFLSLLSFVLTLFADLIQNRSLSLQWFDYYKTMKEIHHKDEEDDVKEPESKNKVGWLLYRAKFWTLVSGYFLLFLTFIIYIKHHTV